MMKRLFRIAKSNPESSASAVAASAAVPSSGFTFVDNSQGASAAVAELSTVLESALEQIDLRGDLNGQLKELLHQLDHEASKYSNSQVTEKEACVDWKCSQAKAQLVSIAWKCAHGTYHAANDIVDTAEYTVQSDHVATPSLGGSVKAWTSTVVTPQVNSVAGSEFLPVLVIAVRGSASNMDHVVNANERPRATGHFIDPAMTGGLELLAHSGFLNSAEALDNNVSRRIQRYVNAQGSEKKHVVFTGHSAGGAVASLLFLRYLSNASFGDRAKFSCINFGSPPSVTLPIDLARYQTPSEATVALSIINEFDLSPLSLSEEWTDDEDTVDAPDYSLGGPSPLKYTTAAETPRDFEKAFLQVEGNTWPVSRLFYHHIGPRVVLMMRLQDDAIQLKAVEVPSSEFEKLLFCRIAVHSGKRYSDRVQLVNDAQGSSWYF
ncbi:hypothetical protein G7Z17_g8654 [Cylindrodendrum hubeiense]|uniref:Fungal lipase-type domain-containing protein n=1 Tax=Cylindrodendrum hubeiense TaxID=595255 RepID=A0A9P5H4T2_9HYPO|nr:hypothetical protein G7Z17_g8654 [Cylindrodendrum hubeiense]